MAAYKKGSLRCTLVDNLKNTRISLYRLITPKHIVSHNSMSESTSGPTPEYSKHILVLSSDYVDYKDHMDLDAEVQKCLDQSKNERLKSPNTPQDYLALLSLILENTPYHVKYHTVEHHVSIVKERFLDPGIESSEWKDLTRMLDMCLERGRFRAVRVMCKQTVYYAKR